MGRFPSLSQKTDSMRAVKNSLQITGNHNILISLIQTGNTHENIHEG
jgi:hypothetical protein